MALLEVDNLDVRFPLRHGEIQAVRDLSFTLERGERLGIVGESGAGKSVLGFSLVNLLAAPGRIIGGSIRFEGRELIGLPEHRWRHLRGRRIAMIFQDPRATLNPVLTIGAQMIETVRAHRRLGGRSARAMVLRTLEQVRIDDPESRLAQYPHELSGGLCQRVVIAIALLLDPDIIVADEPTTSLDVTIQADIVNLLLTLCQQRSISLILISHDLGVVNQLTHRLMIMYAGAIVEQGPTRQLLNDPQHPYTQALINALPEMTPPRQPLQQLPGAMPSLSAVPTGCAFHPRCPYRLDALGQPRQVCIDTPPDFTDVADTQVACHVVRELIATTQDSMPFDEETT
ncbi:ABC transporter ATP-binding protein [Salinicola rhizosphaerae]|uniref:ABC-type dipeptide transporter n=1 Tax=Salinicola rhizosphaerae TaxID=1443141 RepID=A0ABQ3DPF7_9GAMM|nr:ABC transporter ATP-binding protein [Salinicola rhizosphaerae]GHB09239.1 ABC transporter ATP-binding protein [Salinicola rhizosphaerae]